jgi:hypothetical protein
MRFIIFSCLMTSGKRLSEETVFKSQFQARQGASHTQSFPASSSYCESSANCAFRPSGLHFNSPLLEQRWLHEITRTSHEVVREISHCFAWIVITGRNFESILSRSRQVFV